MPDDLLDPARLEVPSANAAINFLFLTDRTAYKMLVHRQAFVRYAMVPADRSRLPCVVGPIAAIPRTTPSSRPSPPQVEGGHCGKLGSFLKITNMELPTYSPHGSWFCAPRNNLVPAGCRTCGKCIPRPGPVRPACPIIANLVFTAAAKLFKCSEIGSRHKKSGCACRVNQHDIRRHLHIQSASEPETVTKKNNAMENRALHGAG